MTIDYHYFSSCSQENPASICSERQAITKFGPNNQLVDLGMNTEFLEQKDMVQKKIEELSSEMDLVMIVDKIDESLVLLADLLCLPLHRVVSLKLNSRKESVKVGNQNPIIKTKYVKPRLGSRFKPRTVPKNFKNAFVGPIGTITFTPTFFLLLNIFYSLSFPEISECRPFVKGSRNSILRLFAL